MMLAAADACMVPGNETYASLPTHNWNISSPVTFWDGLGTRLDLDDRALLMYCIHVHVCMPLHAADDLAHAHG